MIKILLPKEYDPIFDDIINSIISDMYRLKAIPSSFVFERGVRIVIRERMKEMAITSSINNLIKTESFEEMVKTTLRDTETIKLVFSGYILCYYDLNKDR
jgi:hypothetical protein